MLHDWRKEKMQIYQKVAAKLVSVTATAGLALGCAVLMEVAPAKAASFSFTQTSYPVGGSVSGGFTGTDLNGDGKIDLSNSGQELSDFQASFFPGNGTQFTLNRSDLVNFNYRISDASLSFDAFDNSTKEQITVGSDALSPDKGVVHTTTGTENTGTAPTVAGVPESSNVAGVCLLGLAGVGELMKKKRLCCKNN